MKIEKNNFYYEIKDFPVGLFETRNFKISRLEVHKFMNDNNIDDYESALIKLFHMYLNAEIYVGET